MSVRGQVDQMYWSAGKLQPGVEPTGEAADPAWIVVGAGGGGGGFSTAGTGLSSNAGTVFLTNEENTPAFSGDFVNGGGSHDPFRVSKAGVLVVVQGSFKSPGGAATQVTGVIGNQPGGIVHLTAWDVDANSPVEFRYEPGVGFKLGSLPTAGNIIAVNGLWFAGL